jgi:hypothetical protein
VMWFRPGVLFGGLTLLCWAAVAMVAAALTTWWVLLALLPLLMMGSGMTMMGTMARRAGTDPRPGPWLGARHGSTRPAERGWKNEHRVGHSSR